MSAIETYDEWKAHALEEDAASGASDWKIKEETTDFDYRVIRRRYQELVAVREEGDIDGLCYYLNEGIHGNMAGMGAPKLYTRAAFGTKKLIEDYNAELVAALRLLADAPEEELPKAEKLAMLRRVSQCYGHSALMLSGAGSLGPFHLGVVRALHGQGLLPRIISGASAGAMIAAIVGTRTNDELTDFLGHDWEGQYLKQIRDSYEGSGERPIDQYDARNMINALVPDLTFVEAFEKTGRYINISVAPKEILQRSRLLNAITSPNATIREAVLASGAIPGLFPSITLMAKDRKGNRKPYVPSRQWVDGSVSDDLPAKRLARMYGVNHTISSQANPLVLWAVQDPNTAEGILGRYTAIFQQAQREWMRVIYPSVMEGVRDYYPLNLMTRTWFSMMTQSYTADVTIMPHQRFYRPSMFLERLSAEETKKLIDDGERSTWPVLERVRTTTMVSRCLDEILLQLDGTIR